MNNPFKRVWWDLRNRFDPRVEAAYLPRIKWLWWRR